MGNKLTPNVKYRAIEIEWKWMVLSYVHVHMNRDHIMPTEIYFLDQLERSEGYVRYIDIVIS